MPPLLICHRLLLILLLSVAASHGDSSNDAYDSSMCLDQPYTCGGVKISYPFYLAEETKELKGYDNSYCGYPGLGIVCDGGKPTLQLDGPAKYTITSINGTIPTVSLTDPKVLGGGTDTCPRPIVGGNVTLSQGSWLFFPDSTVDYLVFLIDCSFGSGFPRPSNIDPISCQGFGGGPGLSFVLPDDEVPARNWSHACRQVIQLPVNKNIPVDHTDYRWRNSEYGKLLREGFQLGLNDSVKPQACIRCEQSNGKCGYSQGMDFIDCLCPDGRMHSDNCVKGAALSGSWPFPSHEHMSNPVVPPRAATLHLF
ncbi:hypothetical protein BRADI_2g47008v3 [Brachypodium distachyon]|uniref:Wall-associated receptor kinase galacturonan-binding domain-containing protein n=1 Tax=Brachypodium distachyon TaxID=15368 RepID=A0A2K2DEA7_BRADI|nr:hypothetical protein BRADI_2g47008v3 [Brachypodium distachyon]